MATKVHIPSLLRRLFHSDSVVQVNAASIAELVRELDKNFPGMAERLIEPDGSIRRYVNIFVSHKKERVQGNAGTQLEKDAEVWIVPNIAGGRNFLRITAPSTRTKSEFM
ncbi:MAG: molybdopterin synthase sulfur carrier subunit [Chloroflexi bacterium]|nr:molybdopterin synthase sulfur carrier subunit [Chloroflexota bacterium]